MINNIWSEQDYTTVRDLHKHGKTWDEIGQIYGITGNATKKRVRKYFQRKAKTDVGDSITEQGENNQKTFEYVGPRIRTLDDLLSACKVDLNEWAVDHWITNKWEVGRKAQVKHLEWTDGIMNGREHDDGLINVEPLFQIKVWLIRKEPIAIKPVIRPINLEITSPKVYRPEHSKMKSALILPDPHFGFSRDVRSGALQPFHDRQALSLAMRVAQLIQPDQVIWLGDVNDFSALTDRFIHQPEFYFTIQPVLIEAAWVINQVNQDTGQSTILEGNHDKRFQTQTINHLVDAYELRSADNLDASSVLSVDNLLGLSRSGIKYMTGYPDSELWLNDYLRCEHGSTAKSVPGATTKALTDKENVSIIFGHIHRIELSTKTVWERNGCRNVMSYSPGCLCHIDGRVPGSQRGVQWQQGMALVHYDDENFTLTPLVIQSGQIFYNGRVIESYDYLPEVQKVSKWDRL